MSVSSLLGNTFPAGCLLLFNWINRVMEDMWEKSGHMQSAEASHGRTAEGRADQADNEVTIDGLIKKYPCWALRCSQSRQMRLSLLRPRSCSKERTSLSIAERQKDDINRGVCWMRRRSWTCQCRLLPM
jgi:hypothetical protein